MSIVVSDYVKGHLQKIKDEKEHTSFDSVIRELLSVYEGKVDIDVLWKMNLELLKQELKKFKTEP